MSWFGLLDSCCCFGCGRPALFLQKNGRSRCDQSVARCPVIKARSGERSGASRVGSVQTSISNEKRRRALVGKARSPDAVANAAAGFRKAMAERSVPRVPWNKGVKGHQTPWNKGLRKREPIPVIGLEDPIYSDFKKYRNRVSSRTRRNYREFESIVNPQGFPIGKCGVDGAYQVDHKVSVREGFERKLAVEFISSIENLQVIPWLDNIRKYDGTRSV